MQRFAACGECSEYSNSILFSSTWLPGSIMPHLNMTDNIISLDCDISSATSCACESINSKMYAATCSDSHMSGLGFTVMKSQTFTGFELPIIPLWQLLVTAGVFGFLFVLQRMELSKRIRARIQPYVCRQVEKEVSAVLFVQVFKYPISTLNSELASFLQVNFFIDCELTMGYCVRQWEKPRGIYQYHRFKKLGNLQIQFLFCFVLGLYSICRITQRLFFYIFLSWVLAMHFSTTYSLPLGSNHHEWEFWSKFLDSNEAVLLQSLNNVEKDLAHSYDYYIAEVLTSAAR